MCCNTLIVSRLVCQYLVALMYRARKNSVLKLHEVTGGTKTTIYCQGTVCGRCGLAAVQTGKLGLTRFRNQAKPRKYSAEKLYLLPMKGRRSNARSPVSIHSRQRRSRDGRVRSKNARLLPDGCCCLNKRAMRPSAESTSHRKL